MKIRFLRSIDIEFAQLFDFNRCRTLVCHTLWNWHDHQINEDSKNGHKDREPWVFISKAYIRQCCFGWVSLRKIDEVIEYLESSGLLKVDRSREGQQGGRTGYLLLVDEIKRRIAALPECDEIPEPEPCPKRCAGYSVQQDVFGNSAEKDSEMFSAIVPNLFGNSAEPIIGIRQSSDTEESPTPSLPTPDSTPALTAKAVRWAYKSATNKQLTQRRSEELLTLALINPAAADQFLSNFSELFKAASPGEQQNPERCFERGLTEAVGQKLPGSGPRNTPRRSQDRPGRTIPPAPVPNPPPRAPRAPAGFASEEDYDAAIIAYMKGIQ